MGEDSCYDCGDVIGGAKVIALGKSWHPEHLMCVECKNVIPGDLCCEINGAPVCEEDYLRFMPQCAYCKKPVTGKFLKAMNMMWHPEHFTCAQCQTSLQDSMFFEKDGRPYCRADYQRCFALRCGACNAPIIGTAVMALEKYWHPTCFKCTNCCGQIHGNKFKLSAGKPACFNCPPPKMCDA